MSFKKQIEVEIIEIMQSDSSFRVLFRSNLNEKEIKKHRNKVLKMLCIKDSAVSFWDISPFHVGDANYIAERFQREKPKKTRLDILHNISLGLSITALILSILTLVIRVLTLI